jgi:pilus assembly protein FimV
LIALAIASFPFGAQAAGLGQINVLSGLGEALRAEIPINATQQELQSLTARIAQPEAFLQANVAYAGFVPAVRVAVENRGGRSVLRLSSHLPVDEPSASLIVEMTWDDGRLMRTYNFLLDPPEMIHQPVAVAPPVVTPPAQAEDLFASQPQPSSPTAQTPIVSSDPFWEPASQTASPGGETPTSQPPADTGAPYFPPSAEDSPGTALQETYVVKRGDTAGEILRGRRPAGIDRYQMLEAVRRGNPSAFIGDNINRIKTGAVIKLPTADEAAVIDKTEARNAILMQAREFDEWRIRMAERAGTMRVPLEEDSPGGTVGSGVDTVGGTRQVDISSGDRFPEGASAEPGSAVSSDRLRQLQETNIAIQNELREKTERVQELEEIVQKYETLVDDRNRKLAQAQQELLAMQGSASTVAEQPFASVVPPEPVAQSDSDVVPPEPVVTPPNEPIVVPPEELQPEVPAEREFEVRQEEPPRVVVPPPPRPTYDDPLTAQNLGIGALVIALLGAFLGFRSWQRKRADSSLETLSQDTSIFPSENTSTFGENGGQSVDTTGSSSVIHTDFSHSGFSIDTNEGVDPVAEADVYMAYGRDTQAEEILNDALKADPQRGAIYAKLLEIYVQRNDLGRFESTASELFSRTQGQGRDWEKAAQMGRKLDPANPLYAASAKTAVDDDEDEITPLRASAGKSALRDSGAENGGGPQLASLDFSNPPVSGADAYPGQLKETVVARGKVDELQAARGRAEAVSSDSDFDLGMAEQRQKTVTARGASVAGGGNFDFGGEQQRPAAARTAPAGTAPRPAGTASRQPSAVPAGTASRQPAARQPAAPAAGTASRQPAATPASMARQPAAASAGTASRQPTAVPVGTASRRPAAVSAGTASRQPAGTVSRPVQRQSGVAATGGVAGDLVAPLEFDLPELEQNAGGGDMNATVVLPPIQGGDGDMDFEKTSFNPQALDFSLDLDSTSARNDAALGSDADMAGEVETKLELARAYEDMGDSEGALELLREVVAEGNASQRATAQALIDKLS